MAYDLGRSYALVALLIVVVVAMSFMTPSIWSYELELGGKGAFFICEDISLQNAPESIQYVDAVFRDNLLLVQNENYVLLASFEDTMSPYVVFYKNYSISSTDYDVELRGVAFDGEYIYAVGVPNTDLDGYTDIVVVAISRYGFIDAVRALRLYSDVVGSPDIDVDENFVYVAVQLNTTAVVVMKLTKYVPKAVVMDLVDALLVNVDTSASALTPLHLSHDGDRLYVVFENVVLVIDKDSFEVEKVLTYYLGSDQSTAYPIYLVAPLIDDIVVLGGYILISYGRGYEVNQGLILLYTSLNNNDVRAFNVTASDPSIRFYLQPMSIERFALDSPTRVVVLGLMRIDSSSTSTVLIDVDPLKGVVYRAVNTSLSSTETRGMFLTQPSPYGDTLVLLEYDSPDLYVLMYSIGGFPRLGLDMAVIDITDDVMVYEPQYTESDVGIQIVSDDYTTSASDLSDGVSINPTFSSSYSLKIVQKDTETAVGEIRAVVADSEDSIVLQPSSTGHINPHLLYFLGFSVDVVMVKNRLVVISVLRTIENISIDIDRIVLELDSKGDIVLVSPKYGISRIVVDYGNGTIAELCGSPSECEKLRDEDGVIVFDPVKVTIYFTTGTSTSMGGEIAGIGTIFSTVLVSTLALLILLMHRPSVDDDS